MSDGSSPPGCDPAALGPFFAGNVEGAGAGRPLQASLIEGGRSNLTYTISDGRREWVLRRPPLGHVLPTAHDMAREFRVLAGVAGAGVPVPRPLAHYDDASLIGAPFYVMEKVDGRILRSAQDASGLSPDDARLACRELVDVLVRIHAVDFEAAGLAGLGHPEGYLGRQVRRWWQQWERSKTRDLPAMEELRRRLSAALPRSGPPAVVHGDYRFDNTMFDWDDPGRIVAVLDWEMATLGDPLADVGLLLTWWAEPGEAGVHLPPAATVTAQPGFFTRAEVAEAYARASGRDLGSLDFYVVLGHYKLAIIAEGIFARFLQGKTVGEGFEGFAKAIPLLAETALDLAGRSSIPALAGRS